MKNNWKNDFESKCESGHFKIGEIDKSLLVKFIESLLEQQKKELLQQERQFILNILDGIDKADEIMGITGGTQAIRQALQSRVI